MLDALTLDQMRVLVAIADRGSFRAAAQNLQRAQSSISHAVASIESQLTSRSSIVAAENPPLPAKAKRCLPMPARSS